MKKSECAVVSGDIRRSGWHRKNSGEVFTAGFEPFVEHFCLEQRSREAGKGEARIRFACPKPPPHERESGFVSER